MNKLNIPVGISDFAKIREENYYYIDKTGLIADLIDKSAEVTLITRPRRFGKTLGMSMLYEFFDIRKNSREIFAGLEIAGDAIFCDNWMNKFPTVFVSFRNVDGLDFDSAYDMMTVVIANLFKEHLYLLDSDSISEFDKDIVRSIVQAEPSPKNFKNSLLLLTRLLHQYYGRPVILLMDEYDVPVAKANSHGYYKEMLDVMKGLMQVMKDNASLKFAVITGCLRIAKESIFTGMNNFVSDTITDSRLNEYFGFTQAEVDKLLSDADAVRYADTVREWYDGYHFGAYDIYCPWDVMNYMLELQYNKDAKPASYWKNTSDNAVIRSFIDFAGGSITHKLEQLMAGEFIVQHIDEYLTYDYLNSSEDNLWSVLYLTGYLTVARDCKDIPDNMTALMIPNREIKDIFETTVIKWFNDSTAKWDRSALFDAIWSGNSEVVSAEMNRLLRRTISYHDYKEDFYHAFLAGIFTGAGYMVESNKEHGEGRSDIVVYDLANARVAVFEAKYTRVFENLQAECDRALAQIDSRMYAKEFEEDYDEVFCYGISFFKKRCVVKNIRL